MTYVALVEAAALVAISLVFAGVVRAQTREFARERNLMLNQLLHLAGRTWEPPPIDTWQEPVDEIDPTRFVTTPGLDSEEF